MPDERASRSQRMLLGILVLLLVDIIWVSSSELTKYLYQNIAYEKPFFTTYVKTSLFTIYLLGLCFWPPWRDQCLLPSGLVIVDSCDSQNDSDNNNGERVRRSLSDPQFVPIKKSDKSSGTESDDSSVHSVRFNRMTEVRHMSQVDATDALIARLSYQASLRLGDFFWSNSAKLPVIVVMKIACTFCVLWFIANYTFQLSLKETEAAIVTVLSSSSGLFTLILAAMYPANIVDHFSLSKLVAVLCSISGLVITSYSDLEIEGKTVPFGAFLSLLSALFYAAYLVFLRRKVDSQEKLDIPLFFGFVGLFNFIFLWPFFFLLHYNRWETFEWPNKQQWVVIIVNGFVGTVLSEVLWLWGCYLTSSLIATMAISLTVPMSMLADVIVKQARYPILFYIGVVPTLVSFTAITLLTHYENWDPVMNFFRNIFRRRLDFFRETTDTDMEQAEALISENHEC